jgi:hypothetical protein
VLDVYSLVCRAEPSPRTYTSSVLQTSLLGEASDTLLLWRSKLREYSQGGTGGKQVLRKSLLRLGS